MKNQKTFEETFKEMEGNLLKAGYKFDTILAQKTWTLSDVIVILKTMQILPTEELIKEVLKFKFHQLENCTDEEWNSIELAICDIRKSIEKSKELI